MISFDKPDFDNIIKAYCRMMNESADDSADTENSTEYDVYGFDSDGYDRYGKNIVGINRDGYDDEGYDVLGFDKDGWNKEGWPSPRRNPEAYGLKPEEVDDWIAKETEKVLNHGRSVMAQRKHVGTLKDGHYAERFGKPRKFRPNPAEVKMFRRLKEMNKEAHLKEVNDRQEKRRADREAYLNSEEGRAETRRREVERRQKQFDKRHTPEFREKHAAYQRDLKRAERIYSGRNGRLSVDDILWMKLSPVYQNLKARKDAEAKKKNVGSSPSTDQS